MIRPELNEYELLDSGGGRKLERFGPIVLSRPCEQAGWKKASPDAWESATAFFHRDKGWQTRGTAEVPESWIATIDDIAFALKTTPGGHVGVFPETRALWKWITDTLQTSERESPDVLNLFAHSGAATLAAARAGATVCHVDAARSIVTRAKENAELNKLGAAPIRWIVDDVDKFLDREIRRGHRYDAVILDPPTFGRGAKGEQYRIEKDLLATVARCRSLLTEKPIFMLLSAHTRGTSAADIEGLVDGFFSSGKIESGEMKLEGRPGVRAVADGVWSRWTAR